MYIVHDTVYIVPRELKLPFHFNYTLGNLKVYIPTKLVTPDIRCDLPIYKLEIYDKKLGRYIYSLNMIYDLI